MSDNLFEAPKTPIGKAAGVSLAYRPTRQHLQILMFYRNSHVNSHVKTPSVGTLLRQVWLKLVMILVLISYALYCLLAYDLVAFSWFLIGLASGSLARLIGIIRNFGKGWPMMNAIIDWNKVDELLDESTEFKPIS